MKLKNVSCIAFALLLMLFSASAFAQLDTAAVKNGVVASQVDAPFDIKGAIIGILLFGGSAFITVHMILTLIKTKRLKGEFSVHGFKTLRQEKGMDEESTPEENAQCESILDQAFFTWTHVEAGDNGSEYRKPKRMKEIVVSADYLHQVCDIAPTDPDVIATLNQYRDVVHSNERRSFDGSRPLIILGLVISIIVGLIGMGDMGSFWFAFFTFGAIFWVPVIIYYISSLTPQFLIDKRANRGGGNVSSGLVAIAFAVLGSGYTVRTHYTDGTHSDDSSGHVIALVLGAIVALFVALTIIFWSFINYLRNYVLYF